MAPSIYSLIIFYSHKPMSHQRPLEDFSVSPWLLQVEKVISLLTPSHVRRHLPWHFPDSFPPFSLVRVLRRLSFPLNLGTSMLSPSAKIYLQAGVKCALSWTHACKNGIWSRKGGKKFYQTKMLQKSSGIKCEKCLGMFLWMMRWWIWNWLTWL